ncbi:MAG: flagellar assembly protein FliH [Magnetococcus sp. WYHC-3]
MSSRQPIVDGRDVGSRVAFAATLEKRAEGSTEFVRYMPNGQLPRKAVVEKPPEISPEELHRRRLEKIERDTYQKVFAAAEEAGFAAGLQKMEQRIGLLLPQLEQVLRQLEDIPQRAFEDSERLLVETSLALTRQLLGHELTVQPEGIAQRVRRALKSVASRDRITVRVAPECAEILERLPGFHSVSIEADSEVPAGSVRLESAFGGLEDNLQEQLAAVEHAFREYFRERLETMRHGGDAPADETATS